MSHTIGFTNPEKILFSGGDPENPAIAAATLIAEQIAAARPFPNSTLITWGSRSAKGITYRYAAIFASGSWYTTIPTGNAHLRPVMSHDELLEYFRDRGDHLVDLRVATEFVSVSL